MKVLIAMSGGVDSSVAAKILMDAGYRVGMFISPHLVDYRERIRIDHDLIDPEAFVTYLDRVLAANETLVSEGFPHATFFEFLTSTALLYFADAQPDLCILETGVGGRLDATNIVPQPVCCLITSISLDHTRVLGSTLEEIAGEKAGIMKAGVPVVIAKEPDCVTEVLCRKAQEKDSPLSLAQPALFRTRDGQGYALSLQGAYQYDNAEAVLETVRVLRLTGIAIPEEAVARGLEHTIWPGRMQRVSVGNGTLILDGAHNPHGIKATVASLKEHFGDRKLTFVMGVMADKDVSHMVEMITPLADRVYTARPENYRAMDAMDLARQFQLRGAMALPCPSIQRAVDEAIAHEGPDGVVVALGSLYFSSDIRQAAMKHVKD